MKEPRTPIPWTPRTILRLAVAEDVDFAVLAANQHAKLMKALKGIIQARDTFHGGDLIRAIEKARAVIEEVARESEKRSPS